MLTRRRLIALSAASVFAPNVITRVSAGRGWPDRPVHMIVPIAAGGRPTPTPAWWPSSCRRFWASRSSSTTKAAPAPISATSIVAHADPDGYTVLYGTSSLALNGALYRSLDYNPVEDLAPVSLVAKFPFFMFVPNSSPAKTVDGVRRLRQGASGQARHGLSRHRQRSASRRSAVHADGRNPDDACALSRRGSGIHRSHSRPHRLLFRQRRVADLFAVRPGARAGLERSKRSPAAPDLPTIAESGFPVTKSNSWQGVFAPAKTPPDIIRKMNADIVEALADPALVEQAGAHRLYGAKLVARGAAGVPESRHGEVEGRRSKRPD